VGKPSTLSGGYINSRPAVNSRLVTCDTATVTNKRKILSAEGNVKVIRQIENRGGGGGGGGEKNGGGLFNDVDYSNSMF
jgi:hypothetical protein